MAEERKIIKIKGKFTFGMLRGGQFVQRFYHRLTGILGYKPFPGTLNVLLEKPIDMKEFETKRIEHILMDGSKYIEARLAPIKLYIKYENEIKEYPCWIMRQPRNIHAPEIVEVITKDDMKEKFGCKEGDEIEIELEKIPMKRYEQIREKFKSVLFREHKIKR